MFGKKTLIITDFVQKFSPLRYGTPRSDPINATNALDIVSKLPKLFKLNVNEKFYFINKDVAYHLCSKILISNQNNHNQHNEELLSFDVNIKDPENKMQLFVDICNGKVVNLNLKKDRDFFFSLSQILGFNLPSSFTIANSILSCKNSKTIQLSLLPTNVIYFLKNVSDFFEITTKNGKYHFPYTIAPLSNLLYDLLSKDPKIRSFNYSFDDSNSEFKIIERFLSGNKINIIPQNIEYVTQFARELDIPLLIEKIDHFSKEFEYSQQILDEEFNQDSNLTDLQDLLFDLNDQNLSLIINQIENSIWTSSFEFMKELISNIAVVACYRHSHLKNLVKLCQHLSQNDPKFLKFLTNFVLKISNDSILLCQFVYFLTKENVISIKDVLKFITFQYTENISGITYYSMLIFFFLPEILSEYPYVFQYISPKLKSYFMIDILNPSSYDFSRYCESREKMQNLDPMAISIANGDIVTLQKQIAQNSFDVKRIISQCQFDNIEDLSLLNYAAIRGSINCFKYLVLNGADIVNSTFINAVIGGNTEIIRIVEQKLNSETDSHTNDNNNNFPDPFLNGFNYLPTFYQTNSLRRKFPITDFPGRAFKGKKNLRPGLEDPENETNNIHRRNRFALNYTNVQKYRNNQVKIKYTGLGTPIITNHIKTNLKDYLFYAAASYHQNGIFEWIIQQATNQTELIEFLRYCLHATTESNNINALVYIIDNGVTLSSPQNYLANILLTTAALYGFSDVFRIILNSAGNDALLDPTSGSATTLIAASQFGSMKIIEMIVDSGIKFANEDIRIAIHESIDQHNFDVFHKLVEDFNFNIEEDFLYLLFVAATSGSTEIIDYLLTKYPHKLDNVFDQNAEYSVNIDGICSIAAKNGQFESIEIIFNFLIKKLSQIKSDSKDSHSIRTKRLKFSHTLAEAAKSGSIQICDFLLKNGATLEPESIKDIIADLSMKGMTDVIKLLFTSFTDTMKNQLAEKFIITAIDSHKIDIALLFVELCNVNGNALIHAAQNGLYTIVNEMLCKNSTPEFLNTNSKDGTALCQASQSNHVEIVKLLISKPGIDVHAYNSSHDTALIIAAKKHHFEIIKLLAPFCNEKRHRWEMSAAFCIYYCHNDNIGQSSNFDDFLFSAQLEANSKGMNRFMQKNSFKNFDISPAIFFLDFQGIDLNYTYQGVTILGEAIESGCLPLIELLLSRPEFETSIFTGLNAPVLSLASQTCDIQTVCLLLNKLVQINNGYNDHLTHKQISNLFNEKEFYDIFVSANINGRIDLVKFFMSEESPIKITENAIIQSLSILMSSCNEKSNDIIALLMTLDFDVNAKILPRNQSLLDISSSSGSHSSIERIIAHPRFIPNKQEVKHALFSIISTNNINLMDSLLAFLNDDVNQINTNGESLLICAVALLNFNMVNKILNHHSFNPIRSMLKKAFFLSLLKAPNIAALFIGSNFIDINEPFQEEFSFIHGIFMNLKDSMNEFDALLGWTPLMIAGTSNDIVDLILNAPNIDINRKGSNGSAPIFVALTYKHNLFDLLLQDQRLDLNIQNNKGWTPLIDAAQFRDFSAALKILKSQHEIDISIKDNNGFSAIDYFEMQKVFEDEKSIPKTKTELIESLTKFIAREGISNIE